MATLLDHEREDAPIELPEGAELGDLNDLDATSKPEATAEEPSSPAEDDTIPDKFRGKTQAELVAMLQENERFRGKQSQEVGELRRNVDQLIQAQLNNPAAAPAAVEEDKPIDFYEDPTGAMDQRIQNHPDVKAAALEREKYAKQTAQSALSSKHPDMNEIVHDEAFLTWVGESNVRRRLFQQAHKQYDYEAADELFSIWKERKGIAAQTLEVEKKERKQAVAAANTGAAPASTAGSPKKMYRRSDVIRLMNEDPDRYAALSDEIMTAYAEGRVVT